MKVIGALAFCVAVSVQSAPGAKAMFYNPGGISTAAAARMLPGGTLPLLREVNYLTPLRHCGVHYWFESEGGISFTEASATTRGGRFVLKLRSSCNGILTVFDMAGEGQELTPRFDARYSGHKLGDQIYTVPGVFDTTMDKARHVIIVWARSQTEVARDVADAPNRVKVMASWRIRDDGRVTTAADVGTPAIVREVEESVPGEIGTYVVNRQDAGVATDIRFPAR